MAQRYTEEIDDMLSSSSEDEDVNFVLKQSIRRAISSNHKKTQETQKMLSEIDTLLSD